MKHRPTGLQLNVLRNEVPGGAALADELAKLPDVIHVTETQLKFMKKLDLISEYIGPLMFKGTSIRVELAV